jgi:hypothetical protein
MANIMGAHRTRAEDEDAIIFLPPAPSSSIHPAEGPTMHRETVEVAVAKDVTGLSKPEPPTVSPQPPTRQAGETIQLVSLEGAEEATVTTLPTDEPAWKRLQIFICLCRSEPHDQLSFESDKSSNTWKFDAIWKRVCRRFSSAASDYPGSATPENESQQTPRTSPTGLISSPSVALALQEVDILLEDHRSRVLDGHQGRLRGMLLPQPLMRYHNGLLMLITAEPPNPNNPETPPRPIPRFSRYGGANRRSNSRSNPSVLASATSTYSPGILAPSSVTEYEDDPDDFYGGPSFSHSEDVSLENRDDPPSGASDTSSTCSVTIAQVNTVDQGAEGSHASSSTAPTPDSRTAQIGRNDDLSDLLSEVRYPPHAPSPLRVSVSGGESSGTSSRSPSESNTSPSQRLPGIVEIIAEVMGSPSPSSASAAAPISQTDGSGEIIKVSEEAIGSSESTSSSSDDIYWAAESDFPSGNSTPKKKRKRFGLEQIDEEDGESADLGGVDKPSPDANPELAANLEPDAISLRDAILPPDANPDAIVTMEDIQNAQSAVHESAGEEEEQPGKPEMDKGKGVDREAHPSYDQLWHMGRRDIPSDPGNEPGPSNWQVL